MGREEAHAAIKRHAVTEALRMRERGAPDNRLMELLAEEPAFKAVGVTSEELRGVMRDRSHFVGNAYRQIMAVKEKASPLLEKYSREAAYEPGAIL
jgi:adenylosuccinate lyase